MDLSIDDRLSGNLGGMLGMRGASDELSLARTDRKKLGERLLHALMQPQPPLNPADVYRVIPRRTWIRRKAEGGLTGPEFDGLFRLLRLRLLAELVFGDAERAEAWLHSPKARLGDATPMDFAGDSLGYEAVQAWLHEIDQGFFG